MRIAPALLAAAVGLSVAAPAAAEPFVVLQDDGTIENQDLQTLADLKVLREKLLALYAETGAETPEVLSVWSNFSIGGNYVGTVIDVLGNAVTGIGVGKKTSPVAPLDAILWHNDFTKIPQRANVQHAPEEGFDLYIMGLSPAADVPPFQVLEDTVVPATPIDPLWGGAFAPHSFPWFDQNDTLTVGRSAGGAGGANGGAK